MTALVVPPRGLSEGGFEAKIGTSRLTEDFASTASKVIAKRSMDFKERLQKATERGQQARDEKARAEAAKAMSEEECRRVHSGYRLELTDHIESCLKQLADQFPGFNLAAVADDKGWGAALSRDDLSLSGGKRDNLFSRLTITVAPHNQYHVLSIEARGAIRNKESFTRSHYQLLKDVDLDHFRQLIEHWVLEYAEQYAGE